MNKIAMYDQATAGLSLDERRDFDTYLIGWLMGSVSPETLTAALSAALVSTQEVSA